jgi:hypothetical protein
MVATTAAAAAAAARSICHCHYHQVHCHRSCCCYCHHSCSAAAAIATTVALLPCPHPRSTTQLTNDGQKYQQQQLWVHGLHQHTGGRKSMLTSFNGEDGVCEQGSKGILSAEDAQHADVGQSWSAKREAENRGTKGDVERRTGNSHAPAIVVAQP